MNTAPRGLSEASTGKSSVLVLETEVFAHHALDFLLANAGFEVKFVASWKDATASHLLKTSECLLVNCHLLATNELSIRKLAEANRSLPIIFYSFEDNLLTQVSSLGYRSLTDISGPVDSGTLLTAVEQAVLSRLDRDAREEGSGQLARLIGSLTESERAVLELLAEGLPLEEIAQRRGTSCNTVRNQRSSILDKLGARTDADAARMFIVATNSVTPRDERPVYVTRLNGGDAGLPRPSASTGERLI